MYEPITLATFDNSLRKFAAFLRADSRPRYWVIPDKIWAGWNHQLQCLHLERHDKQDWTADRWRDRLALAFFGKGEVYQIAFINHSGKPHRLPDRGIELIAPVDFLVLSEFIVTEVIQL